MAHSRVARGRWVPTGPGRTTKLLGAGVTAILALGASACSLAPSLGGDGAGPDYSADERERLLVRLQTLTYDTNVLEDAQTVIMEQCIETKGVQLRADPLTLARERAMLRDRAQDDNPLPRHELLNGLELWVPLEGEDLGFTSALEDLSEEDGSGAAEWVEPAVDRSAYISARKGPESDIVRINFSNGGYAEVPLGGCWAESESILFGVPAIEYERTRAQMPRFTQDVVPEVEADPAVVAAVKSWSECMSSAGFANLTTPYDLWGNQETDGPLAKAVVAVGNRRASAAEARVEVQSVIGQHSSCVRRSSLSEFVLLSAHQSLDAVLLEQEGTIAAMREMQAHATALSPRVLSGAETYQTLVD